jgi:hypothetical protein
VASCEGTALGSGIDAAAWTSTRLTPVNLRIRVNDELALDAGTVEDVGGAEWVIYPPRVTLLSQVLDYLRRKPDPPGAPTTVRVEGEGAAAAAIALRWGSYFAVLADSAKPLWNEASAALAAWIDVARVDPIAYRKLVARALAYLPLPTLRPRPVGAEFAMLALPDVAARWSRRRTSSASLGCAAMLRHPRPS